jgi:hypothetical protein
LDNVELIGKNIDENVNNLIRDTMPKFAWKERGKPQKNLSHNNWCADRNSNHSPFEYKPERCLLRHNVQIVWIQMKVTDIAAPPWSLAQDQRLHTLWQEERD